MKQWLLFFVCAALGLALLAGGLLVPAHLRALDAAVLARATRKNEKISTVSANFALPNYGTPFWGDDLQLKSFFGEHFKSADQNLSLADFIVRQENRDAALARLSASSNAAVRELLRSRSLNPTVIFSPSQSASGQAFDTAVVICGLLLDGRRLTTSLNDAVWNFAAQANRGGGSEPLEQTLMDFLSLGERFNWGQLAIFAAKIPDAGTLHTLADEARNAGDHLPVLLTTVQLSGQPVAVADYLAKFPKTGLQDLGASLRYGAGSVDELVRRQQRIYDPSLERRVTAFDPFGSFFDAAARLSFQQPQLALAGKWILYLLAGFFLALALHFAMPPLEGPLRVRGFHLLREFLFSLGFLLVVLLLSEPFLAQEDQKGNFSLRQFPPTVGGAVPAGIASLQQTIMNPTVLLTLLVFFVLQLLIYISCLVKLAEIRRQNIPPRMKLKLLENEDHLFDAGLYLGFVGTIISLIIASLGLVQFSLMAAYSSTSFGIIFVVIFKIFHLRPARRKLLLAVEAQNTSAENYVPAVAPPYTMPS